MTCCQVQQDVTPQDMDGNLCIGRGHSFLAGGGDVQAAGTLKVNSQGYARSITNASGHYAPQSNRESYFRKYWMALGLELKMHG